MKVHSLSPVSGEFREEFGFVSFPIPILVDQDFDVAGTGDHDAPLGINRHGINVVGEIITREFRDFKVIGNLHLDFGCDQRSNQLSDHVKQAESRQGSTNEDQLWRRSKHGNPFTRGESHGKSSLYGASNPKSQVVFTCRTEITDSSSALLSLKSTDRADGRVGRFGG